MGYDRGQLKRDVKQSMKRSGCMMVTLLFTIAVSAGTWLINTLLGGALILLHYWELIAAQPLVLSVLRCFGEYLLFIVPAALVLIVLHAAAHIPKVVFRKLLHLPAFCSAAAVVVWRADSWPA